MSEWLEFACAVSCVKREADKDRFMIFVITNRVAKEAVAGNKSQSRPTRRSVGLCVWDRAAGSYRPQERLAYSAA
jgi:hypothetical protein